MFGRGGWTSHEKEEQIYPIQVSGRLQCRETPSDKVSLDDTGKILKIEGKVS